MHKHKLTIVLEEVEDPQDPTKTVSKLLITHRVNTKIGQHMISNSEPVELSNPEQVRAAILTMIDQNRPQMESLGLSRSISHVAAVENVEKKGVVQLKVGGTMGAIGDPTIKKGAN